MATTPQRRAVQVGLCVALPASAYLGYQRVYLPRTFRRRLTLEGATIKAPVRNSAAFVAGTGLNSALQTQTRDLRATLKFFGMVVARLAVIVAHLLPVAFKFMQFHVFGVGSLDDANQEALRAFIALGPSFIKLGQWIVTRPDVFPRDLCLVLEKLLDKVPPHQWADTEAILRSSDLLHRFERIEQQPLNSGSIAQVYKATLKDAYVDMETGVELAKGTNVVVKVMHPHVRDRIYADVYVLNTMAALVSKLVPGSQYLALNQVAEEASHLLLSQLDFEREADNLLQFRYNFRYEPNTIFPTPLRSWATKDVLVETFETGTPLNVVDSVDKNRLADFSRIGSHMFLKMIFEDNLVHADLHPGNLLTRFINPDGTKTTNKKSSLSVPQLVVLDPGLVTTLSEKDRANFVALFACVAVGDGERGAQLMLERSTEQRCPNPSKFAQDMRELFEVMAPQKSLKGFALGDISVGPFLNKVLDTMRNNQVRIDMNFATLVSSVIVGEGMGRLLEPDLNFFKAAAPFLVQCLRSHELSFLVARIQEAYLTSGVY